MAQHRPLRQPCDTKRRSEAKGSRININPQRPIKTGGDDQIPGTLPS